MQQVVPKENSLTYHLFAFISICESFSTVQHMKTFNINKFESLYLKYQAQWFYPCYSLSYFLLSLTVFYFILFVT